MATLAETIEKANRDKSGKSSAAIRKTAADRLKFKKKGGKTRNSLAEDAEKAVKRSDEAKARKAKRDAGKKGKPKPKPKKKPNNPFSVLDIVGTIRKRKAAAGGDT